MYFESPDEVPAERFDATATHRRDALRYARGVEAAMKREPSIGDRLCTGLLGQGFVFEGTRFEECNVVLVNLDHVSWIRVFVDAGVFFCRPMTFGLPPQDPAYPLIDLGREVDLGDQRFQLHFEEGSGLCGRVRFTFASGRVFELTYDAEDHARSSWS